MNFICKVAGRVMRVLSLINGLRETGKWSEGNWWVYGVADIQNKYGFSKSTKIIYEKLFIITNSYSFWKNYSRELHLTSSPHCLCFSLRWCTHKYSISILPMRQVQKCIKLKIFTQGSRHFSRRTRAIYDVLVLGHC